MSIIKESREDITGVVRLGLVGIATAAFLATAVDAHQRLNQNPGYEASESQAPVSHFTARGLAEIHLSREFLNSLKIPTENISQYSDRVMLGKLNAQNGSIGLSAVAFNTTRTPKEFLGGSITVSSDAPIDPATVLKPESDTEAFLLSKIVTTGDNSFTIDFKPSK